MVLCYGFHMISLLPLLLIGCAPEQILVFDSPVDDIIGQWFYTFPIEGFENYGLLCGFLSSNGNTYARTTKHEPELQGPIDWSATGPYEVTLSDGIVFGTLIIDPLDNGTWNLDYNGLPRDLGRKGPHGSAPVVP